MHLLHHLVQYSFKVALQSAFYGVRYDQCVVGNKTYRLVYTFSSAVIPHFTIGLHHTICEKELLNYSWQMVFNSVRLKKQKNFNHPTRGSFVVVMASS